MTTLKSLLELVLRFQSDVIRRTEQVARDVTAVRVHQEDAKTNYDPDVG
jgi:hypothetical protein